MGLRIPISTGGVDAGIAPLLQAGREERSAERSIELKEKMPTTKLRG